MATSAFLLPWYAPAFLPWLALLIGSMWNERDFSVARLLPILVWYFTTVVIFCYILGLSITNWLLYFGAIAGIVLLGCTLPVFLKRAWLNQPRYQ